MGPGPRRCQLGSARLGRALSASLPPVSLVETVLVFVVIPGAIYGVVALLTLRIRASKTPRYRPGQDWDYPAVWWTANLAGAAQPVAAADEQDAAPVARTAWGGARGSW
jgi:hypothetical protein